jgi:hypothetical protein
MYPRSSALPQKARALHVSELSALGPRSLITLTWRVANFCGSLMGALELRVSKIARRPSTMQKVKVQASCL